MRRAKWIPLGLLGALLLAARAGVAADVTEYDLASAVKMAMASHPRVAGAEAAVRQGAGGVREARAAAMPRLGATLGYSYLQDPPQFQVAPLGTMVFGERDNTTAALSLQYPLYTSGRLGAVRRQAESGLDALLAQRDRVAQQAGLRAAERYFDALKSGSMIGVMEAQVQALEAQQAAVTKMLDAGVVTKIDLLRTNAALASAREGLARARSNQAVGIAALAEAMGLPADTPLRLSGKFDEPDLPSRLDEAAAEALRRRPEFREVQAGLAAADASVQAARSALRPRVNAFVQSDFDRPTYMPRTGTFSAGVVLTHSLFDGSAGAARVQQARAEAERIEAARAELENGVRLDVTQHFLEAQSAGERIAAAQAAVAAAEESHRLATIGYRNQVTPLTDVLQAQADLTRARSDLLLAEFDRRVAQARLRTAMGR
ncbi:MAG: TolC family protein [Armatimonadetes bacterium]|nr:TolC family protein [Armatimonadota bacterium]